MRNTAFAVLGALLITFSTVQISNASERHAHRANRDLRGTYNQLNDPAYEAPATGNGWDAGTNWRDAAKYLPAGS
jgi:hypothetical protein